jgi:hypothetical protein
MHPKNGLQSFSNLAKLPSVTICHNSPGKEKVRKDLKTGRIRKSLSPIEKGELKNYDN